MAKCVGCGLEVAAGLLKAKLKTNGGIICSDTDGLSVNFATTANGGNGLQVGCGLTASEAAISLDIGDAATCGTVSENLLKCVTGDGLRADHQGSIVSNSLTCNQPASFLESANLPFSMAAGNKLFLHTPLFLIKPDCTDATKLWAGVTEFDVGGLFVSVAAGSLVRVSFDLFQNYAPNPVSFGGLNPSFRNTLDNRFGTGVREMDINLHDTTFQSIGGTQTIEFQLRLTVECVLGTGILNKFSEQQWEATWHYSHVIGDFDGCAL